MPLNEENSRIVVLGCILALYVVFGAVILRKFEHPFEKRLLRNYWKMYEEFGEKLTNGTAQIDELNSLLCAYGNVTSSLGVPGKYERWNFLGSLYFVVTIVSTIGTYDIFSINGRLFREHGRNILFVELWNSSNNLFHESLRKITFRDLLEQVVSFNFFLFHRLRNLHSQHQRR